jgi:hypothetical protein
MKYMEKTKDTYKNKEPWLAMMKKAARRRGQEGG